MALSAHVKAQIVRAARLFVVTLGTSLMASDHLDRGIVVAAIVAAAEVTFRQFSKVEPTAPSDGADVSVVEAP